MFKGFKKFEELTEDEIKRRAEITAVVIILLVLGLLMLT